MGWVEDLLTGYTDVQSGGAPVTRRKVLNLVGFTVADDPTNGVTTITVPAGGGTFDTIIEGNNANVNVTSTTVNTTVGMHGLTAGRTVTFPASPVAGQKIKVSIDSTGGTYPVTIAGNGNTINGGSSVTMSGALSSLSFTWTGISALGWVL